MENKKKGGGGYKIKLSLVVVFNLLAFFPNPMHTQPRNTHIPTDTQILT